ncbi:MAG: hypothetical protein AAF753_11615 [Pseudomonadota bacterium]
MVDPKLNLADQALINLTAALLLERAPEDARVRAILAELPDLVRAASRHVDMINALATSCELMLDGHGVRPTDNTDSWARGRAAAADALVVIFEWRGAQAVGALQARAAESAV